LVRRGSSSTSGRPIPTTSNDNNKMPDDKPPKRKPGPQPWRQSYAMIGFQLTPKLHQAMKIQAAERGLNLEDVYREAAESFLARREAGEEVVYLATPLAHAATRTTVLMASELQARVRAVAKSDHQALANLFETAVRFYLRALDHPGV
jgi:hypothetical protein